MRAAVRNAAALAVQPGRNIFLYGDLVNNEQVMAGLKSKGFIVAESTDEILENSAVIIRAHGVGKKIYTELSKKNVQIIDCTCPEVKSIHKIVAEKNAAGFHIVIVGKNGHPEVLGIVGWCYPGESTVIETPAALKKINTTAPLCVVAQTTCKKELWEAVTTQLKDSAEIFDTLCDATARRIEAAVQMARECDFMIVAGDKKSANSVELYEACVAACEGAACEGAGRVFFVSSLEDMPEMYIDAPTARAASSSVKIGITGSASTPPETVEEIADFLRFSQFLSEAKAEIESAADAFLQKLIVTPLGKGVTPPSQTNNLIGGVINNAGISQSPIIKAALNELFEQHQGGKRIRGTLVKLGEEIAAGIFNTKSNTKFNTKSNNKYQKNYLPVAQAYEIFQTGILIHDDVIDKSPTRRGKPTIHTNHTKVSDPHFGISRAICIGDYALFLANSILSELPPNILAKVLSFFSEIQIKTLEGELMDVSLPFEEFTNHEEYVQQIFAVYEYKTAWYTLAGPMMLGALCGGADEAFLQHLREITLPLGIAFQIKDDLLGIFAGEEALGKSCLSDIAEKKQTILYAFAKKNADHSQLEVLEKIYGNPNATNHDLSAIREIFTQTGAKAHAENEIRRLSAAALDSIEKLNIESKSLLRGLVHYLTSRRF
ncbi:MAG: 4-hydroxy-3-methylbut-2-enyl diphosphate reductase [Defluviitaleaceae bacterium]|nr:4-hydroxy-3-methylbut-2-enyl diphosphate reductase [Defluviitaleaceae bacterium]